MRALVMGLGRMGTFHAKVLRDLGYLVTTVDPRPEANAMFRRIPVGRAFEAGVIAVPIQYLAETAVEADRVCNRLLIEKPGAANVDEMKMLRQAIGLNQPAIGYTERFNPVVRALASATATIKDDVQADFTRLSIRATPDRYLDLMTHDVDLCRYLGFTPRTFRAEGGCARQSRSITWCYADRWRSVDLTTHSQSPLHAQWHNFFMPGKVGLASLADAEAVLRQVETLREMALEGVA